LDSADFAAQSTTSKLAAFLDRRISDDKTPREATRALKRHLARSLYKKLIAIPLT
jgi:hypothetical protein